VNSNLKWIVGCQNIHNIMQPGVNIELFDDYENRVLNQAPSMLVVSGRVGYNSNMNGKYIRGKHLHRGRVWYKHIQREWVIRWYVPHRQWLFNYDGLNDRPGSNANVSENVSDPSRVRKNWYIFNGKFFQEDPDVVVEGMLDYCDRIEQYITNKLSCDYPDILPGLDTKFRDALILFAIGCGQNNKDAASQMCEKFPYLTISDSKEILSWLFDPTEEELVSLKNGPQTEINVTPDNSGKKRNVRIQKKKSVARNEKQKKKVSFAPSRQERILFENEVYEYQSSFKPHETLVYSDSSSQQVNSIVPMDNNPIYSRPQPGRLRKKRKKNSSPRLI